MCTFPTEQVGVVDATEPREAVPNRDTDSNGALGGPCSLPRTTLYPRRDALLR
jgi:hypothetical protein